MGSTPTVDLSRIRELWAANPRDVRHDVISLLASFALAVTVARFGFAHRRGTPRARHEHNH